MLTLQKGVQSVVIGTQNMPDWFINGIEHDTLVTSFLVTLGMFYFITCLLLMNRLLHFYFHTDEYSKPISISCDGNYVFLLTSHGINKIGTGFGDTVCGKIYGSSNATLPINSRNLFFLKVNTIFYFFVVQYIEYKTFIIFNRVNFTSNVETTKTRYLCIS